MARVKGGPRARKRHQKTLKSTKGYRGTRHKLFKRAHEAELKAAEYSFAGRRLRRRDMRRLWIQRINAALSGVSLSGEGKDSSQKAVSYSRFIKLLKDAKIDLDRKTLAQLAVEDPEAFKKVVEKALEKEK